MLNPNRLKNNLDAVFRDATDPILIEERNYQKLAIEEKESYKWLASAEQSQRCLKAGGAKMVTHIGGLAFASAAAPRKRSI